MKWLYVIWASSRRPLSRNWKNSGAWIKTSFFVDTGADETFLRQQAIAVLGIDTTSLDVRIDVGGIGGIGVPYFQWQSQNKRVRRNSP